MLAKDYFPGFSQQKLTVDDGIEINTLVGGNGKEPVLLLHGHPETYLMWRFIAPKLAEKYTVVATDLRGYGDSSKPQGLPDHSITPSGPSSRVAVMKQLGFSRFHLAGHDRGARVSHRLIQDYPEKVASCTLLDILPTYDMYRDTNQEFATKYWHWFFYIQPDGPCRKSCWLPTRISLSASTCNARRSAAQPLTVSRRRPSGIQPLFRRPQDNPRHQRGHRASATIDMQYDLADRDKIIQTPLLAPFWGANGVVGGLWDVLACGRARRQCQRFAGTAATSFPEEQPEIVLEAMLDFMAKYPV